MTCSCPKCTAKIELDLSEIPEQGTTGKCPECRARFLLSKEPFAGRAYRKAGAINCVHCGGELGNTIHCPACGVLYPEYIATEIPHVIRKKARKIWEAIQELDFSFGSGYKAGYSGYGSERLAYAGTQSSSESSPKALLITVGLIVIVVASAVMGGRYYLKAKAEQQYSENFTRALYIIKNGADVSLKACAKITASGVPSISADDQSKVTTAKDATEKIMLRLSTPPQKFSDTNEKLGKLYNISTNLYALTLAPSGNLPSFTNAANKSENDFKAAAQELKANLPAELAAELEKAKIKYKGLQDF